LSGYLGLPSPPASWRQVEGSMDQACLRVAAADRLVREAMVMSVPDILHPIQVDENKKGLPKFLWFPLCDTQFLQ
jgi:hypothetical protein